MRVIITGAKGFIGTNFCEYLSAKGIAVVKYDKDDNFSLIKDNISRCDAIVHLAGVNRTSNGHNFINVNYGLTKKIIDLMISCNSQIPLIFTSSMAAASDSLYGESKKMAEDYVSGFSISHAVPCTIFRFPNIYGRYCLPNYNSVVATFCHNIANNLPLVIDGDGKQIIELAYIDDICHLMFEIIKSMIAHPKEFINGKITYLNNADTIDINSLAQTISSFPSSIKNNFFPGGSSSLERKLYMTFLSYLNHEKLFTSGIHHHNEKGDYVEFIKNNEYGQVSFLTVLPGQKRGGHFHLLTYEKFIVVSGHCTISTQDMNSGVAKEYFLDEGDSLSILPRTTHTISNCSDKTVILLNYVSSVNDEKNKDTYFCIGGN
ncbi:MAG: NAD-dependent epimerase/dehydratase family protein [Bacilli bacterium]|nr:NAD-dependent epimerase/dehydratase family protein [Bacilli bacterium]